MRNELSQHLKSAIENILHFLSLVARNAIRDEFEVFEQLCAPESSFIMQINGLIDQLLLDFMAN